MPLSPLFPMKIKANHLIAGIVGLGAVALIGRTVINDPPPPPPPGVDPFPGMNTNFNSGDYISALPFSQVGPRGGWRVLNSNPPTPAPVDAFYDPTGAAQANVFAGSYPYPATTYEVLSENGDAYLTGPGVIDQNPDGSWNLTGSGAVSVVAPSGGWATVWIDDPAFLDNNFPMVTTWWANPLNAKTGTLRVTPDWTLTNNNVAPGGSEGGRKNWEADWSTRPTVFNSSWGDSDGVPVELQARAAKAIGADLWTGPPWFGDETYVRGMADVLKAELAGLDGVLVIELSNEVWNTGFPQGNDARNQDPQRKGGRTYGSKASTVYAWFADQWGPVSKPSVEYVLMGHNIDPTFISDALSTYTGPTLAAIGCAAYVPANTQQYLQTYQSTGALPSEAQILGDLQANMARTIQGVAAHVAIADAAGLKSYVYEGGESIFTSAQPLIPVYVGLASSSGIGDLNADLMDALRDAGVDRYCIYNYCQIPDMNGTWGKWSNQLTPLPGGQAWLDHQRVLPN